MEMVITHVRGSPSAADCSLERAQTLLPQVATAAVVYAEDDYGKVRHSLLVAAFAATMP